MHKRFFAGFTVAELLIVIVVIGIIAGIAMISYRGVQLRGHDTAVQDNLSKIAEGYNNYYTEKTD